MYLNKVFGPRSATDISKFRRKLIHTREKQKCAFDKGLHSLKPLVLGETMCIKYNDVLWKPAVVSDKHDIRLFCSRDPKRWVIL